MEVQYIRKLTTSHMVVGQAGELAEWEREMIGHADIPGVLFAESVNENGTERLWYDITGKQSLETVLEHEELGYSLLCAILTGIYDAVEHLEGILLSADALMLSPEGIFVDYRTQQVWFCYFPESGATLTEAWTRLLEYLLTRLDHSDARAVELAYGIYDKAQAGDGSLSVLKELLRVPYEKEESSPETAGGADGEGRGDVPVAAGSPALDFASPQGAESDCGLEAESPAPAKGKRGAGLLSLSASLKGIFPSLGKAEKGGKAYLDARDQGGMAQREKRHMLFKRRGAAPRVPRRLGKIEKRQREPEREQGYVFEPEEESAPAVRRPTVLLRAEDQPLEGILRYEGKGDCSDLVVTGESYTIGSEMGCEGYIPSETVSRRHARITQKEGVYLIEDLNSSNGTSVGGEMLDYRTKMSLQKNEIVWFADEKFRFI